MKLVWLIFSVLPSWQVWKFPWPMLSFIGWEYSVRSMLHFSVIAFHISSRNSFCCAWAHVVENEGRWRYIGQRELPTSQSWWLNNTHHWQLPTVSNHFNDRDAFRPTINVSLVSNNTRDVSNQPHFLISLVFAEHTKLERGNQHLLQLVDSVRYLFITRDNRDTMQSVLFRGDDLDWLIYNPLKSLLCHIMSWMDDTRM